MDTNLLAYIWRYTKTQRVLVIGLTLISFPILYLSLQIPKIIVNEALSGEYGERILLGLELDAVHFLVILCLVLLALIIINGVLKMRINTLKGIIGERLIRRLRYQYSDGI
jgi:putative ABC transport system ATP-binding protein